MFDKIAIVGLGLIGGSLAKVFRAKKMCNTIIGIDSCSETIDSALADNYIDRGFKDIREGIIDADLIVISVPMGIIKEVLREVFKYAKKNSWVLDVGSVKKLICEEVDILLNERQDITFIGGHPMAGSEKSGFKNSTTELFNGAPFILIPKNIELSHDCEFIKWLKLMDINPIIMEDEEHDLSVGYVSHLPHLISAAIINTINHHTEMPKDVFRLSGSGFRDTTRISDSNPSQWADICLYNSKMNQILDCFLKEIEELKLLLSSNNRDILYNYFLEAKNSKSK